MRLLTLLFVLLSVAGPVSAQVSGPWAKVVFGTDAGPTISSGTGSPEGVVTASGGSLFLQTNGASGFTLWTKVGSGSTGWEAPSGGGGGTHNLLSATHPDTSAATALRGAMLIGNSTPAWSRQNLGAAGLFIRSDGTDAGWSANGSALTSLNGTEVTTGTVADARLSANVSLLGSSITTGEITDATILFADIAQNGCLTNEIPKWTGAAWDCVTDEAGGGGASHTILSATHTDSDPDTLVDGDLLFVNSSDLLDRLPKGTNGQVLALASGLPAWRTTTRKFGITVDGAGSTITTGVKGFSLVPLTGTITEATLLSTDASATACSVVFDVWVDTYANYPPTVADTITASAKPTLSSANKSQDTTLTGWTTSTTEGRIVGWNVDSVTSCTRVTLVLTITQ